MTFLESNPRGATCGLPPIAVSPSRHRHHINTVLLSSVLLLGPTLLAGGAPTDPAAFAINSLGVDLLAKAAKTDQNVVISPYSIQSVMAMASAGAHGVTLTEMRKALHYRGDEAEIHYAFDSLRKMLVSVEKTSLAAAPPLSTYEGTNNPITLAIANRLFGQRGVRFRPEFLSLTGELYDAPFCELDFQKQPAEAERFINRWVEEKTCKRIQEILPAGSLNESNRLVIVDAIYFKAPWQTKFDSGATKPEAFHLSGSSSIQVPMMRKKLAVTCAKREGCTMLGIPYLGNLLQFLILLPDDVDGLGKLEAALTPGLLADGARLPACDAILYLPRLKLEPPLLRLKAAFLALGMKTAFDDPVGSANFSRMASTPAGYLYVSDVFHKTLLTLDEDGTEAIAATALSARYGGRKPQPTPPEIRMDRSFLFAVQHRASGACLFLGRVIDPRAASSEQKVH